MNSERNGFRPRFLANRKRGAPAKAADVAGQCSAKHGFISPGTCETCVVVISCGCIDHIIVVIGCYGLPFAFLGLPCLPFKKMSITHITTTIFSLPFKKSKQLNYNWYIWDAHHNFQIYYEIDTLWLFRMVKRPPPVAPVSNVGSGHAAKKADTQCLHPQFMFIFSGMNIRNCDSQEKQNRVRLRVICIDITYVVICCYTTHIDTHVCNIYII